jgi:hypothetical protein
VETKEAQKRGFSGPAIAVLVAVLVVSVAFVWFETRSATPPSPPPAATAEAKAYVSNLKLSEVELKEAEAWAGNKVVELAGKITNAGDRPVKLVELTCIFLNVYGQQIGRERLAIVRRTLASGETRNFRLPFENIAEGWNQAMPQLVIANLQFE